MSVKIWFIQTDETAHILESSAPMMGALFLKKDEKPLQISYTEVAKYQ
jgi:hypothetical protein